MARSIVALALIALLGCAVAQDEQYPLECPTSTDSGMAGGYSTNTDMDAQKAGLSAVWETIKANPLPVDTTACDVNAATITPTAACSQVVAGTNWILHGEVTFPNCPEKLSIKANVFVDLQGVPTVNADSVALIEEQYPLDCPTSTDTGLAGGFSTNTDMDAQKAGLSAVWETIKANVTLDPLPVNTTSCNIDAATITPTAACSQVVAGTNWILHGEVAFPDCPEELSIKANVFVDLQGVPTVNADEVTLIEPPVEPVDPVQIGNWGACGGEGDACATLAAQMNMSVADMCGNKPWPNTYCGEGYECLPENIYYWQCRPSVSLTCPMEASEEPVPGGFTAVDDPASLQFVVDAAWVDAMAADPTAGLPPNSTCDKDAAVKTPVSGCQQVVEGGSLAIVSFNVTFPNCALYTTIDARVLDYGNGTAALEGLRRAPNMWAAEYEDCEDGTCQKMLVFQEWSQCGGAGAACENAAARLDMEPDDGFCTEQYPFSQCAYGSTCTALNPEYHQCIPTPSA